MREWRADPIVSQYFSSKKISENEKQEKCVYVHKREACGADRHAEIVISSLVI